MKSDWTRQELEDELLRAREQTRSGATHGAIGFVMRLLAEHHPDRSRIIQLGERRADEWRDIESAPRDGRAVLLFMDGEVFTARWINSEEMGPVWATPDGYVVFRAAHWKPLGPLPTLPEGE